MKIAGIEPKPPKPLVIVIPLDRDQRLVFKCKAVLSYDEFDSLVPKPTPEVRNYGPNDGGIKVMADDPKYLEKLNEWSRMKTDWTIIQSLTATEDLEWSSVDMGKPETWHKYTEELKAAGLSDYYIGAINGTAIEACGLSQMAIDEATNNFLASQAE